MRPRVAAVCPRFRREFVIHLSTAGRGAYAGPVGVRHDASGVHVYVDAKGVGMGHPAMVGRVLGTADATPLQFWVAVAPDAYLQLDDVVVTERELPDRPP